MGEAYCGMTPCHCGQPVQYGFDGNPGHHRGMCADCDAVRCDAEPGACGRGVNTASLADIWNDNHEGGGA